MKVKCRKNRLTELIKINLMLCNISKKIILSTIVFLALIYINTNQLLKFSYNNNIDVNIWDGIFRVLNYDSFIIGFYIPFIVILTTFFNTKNDYLKFMMLRINKKSTLIVSKVITNIIVSLIFLLVFFGCLFIVNILMLKFEFGWSAIILNKDSLKIVYHLYPNFFVYDLNPIQSLAISFVEILIASLIVLNLRDIFVNYIKNKYTAYLIMSGYLILNIICNGFSLNEGIFKITEYIGLDTIAILYKHNFEENSHFSVTLKMSITISLIYLFLIVFVNWLLNRRLVVEDD